MTYDLCRKSHCVEGTSDRRKIESIIREPVEIVCTNGTMVCRKWMSSLIVFDKEVYVLVDADDAGEKLRKQFRKISASRAYLYDARTEKWQLRHLHLANVLWGADIDVYTEYLR